MKIITKTLHKKTKGGGDLIDLSKDLASCLESSRLKEGSLTVFVVGSTAGITSFEYEPGLKKDMNALYERLAPKDKDYAHHETWHDDNGHSHVRAAIQGPSLTIPFSKGKLFLGTWQQVVLAEFDTRPRDREVVVQLIGAV